MRRRIQLGAVLLVIAALTAWFWFVWRADRGPSATELETAATQTGPATPSDVQAAQDPQARSPVADPTAPAEPPLVVEEELAHPYLYMLLVRVLDENGLPASGGELRVGPALSSLNIAPPLAEVGGVRTLIWRGKEPQMDVDVQLTDASGMQGSRRVHLRAETPTEIALLGKSSGVAEGPVLRVVIAGGYRLRGWEGSVSSDDELRMQRFPHPHARFGDRFVTPRVEPPSPVQTALGAEAYAGSRLMIQNLNFNVEGIQADVMRELVGRSVSLRLSGRLGLLKDSAEPVPETSRISIHVCDDHGEPAVRALVALGREIDGTEQTTSTDANGDAVFESIGGGWWEARAGGGMGGLARERLFVQAPNPLHWDARLERGARVLGRLLDFDGNPVAGFLVRYESIPDVVARSTTVQMTVETRAGEEISERGEARALVPGELRTPWVDQVVPREDGTFEFANLPGGMGRLLVLDANQPDGQAVIVEDNVLAGEHEYVLRFAAQTATLCLRVLDPVPGESEALEVRAISEATGRGAPFAANEDGALSTSALAPGWYRVEVGARSLGWHDLGRQYVAAGERVDLGTFTPPPPALVRVVLPAPGAADPPPLGLTFYLRRHDLDVRGEPRELGGAEGLQLPAGEYWVFWTTSDGALQHKALKLESGVETELDLR